MSYKSDKDAAADNFVKKLWLSYGDSPETQKSNFKAGHNACLQSEVVKTLVEALKYIAKFGCCACEVEAENALEVYEQAKNEAEKK